MQRRNDPHRPPPPEAPATRRGWLNAYDRSDFITGVDNLEQQVGPALVDGQIALLLIAIACRSRWGQWSLRPCFATTCRGVRRISGIHCAFSTQIPHWVVRTTPPEPPMNELDLFTEALNQTDPADRAAFLDQACAGNPELRRRLEELLAGHAQAENPLDRPPVAPGEFGATVEQPTPSSTGRIRPKGRRRRSTIPIPMRHRHWNRKAAHPLRSRRRSTDRMAARRRWAKPIPMPPRQRNGRPAQPGLRWTNGSERSSPAGTRSSR